jgi:cell shape-determining protein MreC
MFTKQHRLDLAKDISFQKQQIKKLEQLANEYPRIEEQLTDLIQGERKELDRLKQEIRYALLNAKN